MADANLSRRRVLALVGRWAVVGSAGLLVACQSAPDNRAATSAPPSAPATSAPATVAAAPAASAVPTGSPGPSAALVPSPSARPAAAAGPSPGAGTAAPSPGPAVAAASPAPPAVAAATPAPTRPAAVAGKPMYQMDPQHTGRSPHAGPRQPVLLRSFDAGTPDLLPPDAVAPRSDFQGSSAIGPDGTIYIANFVGYLFALRDSLAARDKLDLAWRFRPARGSPFHATPALGRDGTVYIGFSIGAGADPPRSALYALRAPASGDEGQVVWSLDLGDARVMASPTVGPDGTIYVANSTGTLFAVAPDGGQKWTAQTGRTLKSAPALGADGTVYHATMDGKLYAVAPPTSGDQGVVRWTFDFGEHLGPTPLVTVPQGAQGAGGGADGIGSGASPTIGPDGTVYIGANNSNYYAITPTGQLRWLFEAERELAGIWTTAALSPDGRTLYFGANKGGVYALDAQSGARRWQFPVYGSIYASSALDSRGLLYTGTTIEQLYVVDTANGEQIGDYDVKDAIWSAPSIRPDGTVVVAHRGGVVMVLGDQS